MSWTSELPLINGYKVVGVIPVKHDQGLRPPYVIIFHRPKDFTPTGKPDWGTAFWYEGDTSWCWGAYDFPSLDKAYTNAVERAQREGGTDLGVSPKIDDDHLSRDESYAPDFEYGGEG
tara:strand:- start:1775 stop:2128 length:354 start_codon:yes stop_codon:yes gene_type:complete